MLIQKLRLKRGWSQQQLAEASGLSVRTIQRIEAGEPASTETLKSLAAVFEVHFSTLNPEQAPTMATTPRPTSASLAEQQEREAFRHVRRLRGFYMHLYQFLGVSVVLLLINLVFTPGRYWVVWPVAGWGIAILMHGLSVHRSSWGFGPEWERRQVEKRLGRPL